MSSTHHPTEERRGDSLSSLAQLSGLEQPGEQLLTELLVVLRDIVPFDAFMHVGLDARAGLRDLRASRNIPQAVAAEYVRDWHNKRENDFYPSHPRLHKRGAEYDCLRVSDMVPDLPRTDYFRQLLEPSGMRHAAHLMLRDDSRPLGTLMLQRSAEHGDFSDDEKRRLQQVYPYLCQAMSRRGEGVGMNVVEGETPPAWEHYGEESAFLVVDAQGQLRFGNTSMWTLLNRALGRAYDRPALCDPDFGWAQAFLAGLVDNLRRRGPESCVETPATRVSNRYGLFRLQAYELAGTGDEPRGLYGIRIERRVNLIQKLFSLPRFRRLTRRERDVCMLLAQNQTHVELAEALGIKPSTAIYHIRNVYQRLGINQRAEVMPALMSAEA